MATKHTDTCLQKAADNEPLFILRAQDITSPDIIRRWIGMNPQLPATKRDEAYALIAKMEAWPIRKRPD